MVVFVLIKTGWTWFCSRYDSWVRFSLGRACCSVPRSTGSRDWEVPFLLQTLHYTSGRWSCLWVQPRQAWGASDAFVYLQRQTCRPCQRGKSCNKVLKCLFTQLVGVSIFHLGLPSFFFFSFTGYVCSIDSQPRWRFHSWYRVQNFSIQWF